MKRTITAFALLLALTTPAAAQETLGGPFNLTATNGAGSSASYAGKYMFIMFGFSGCGDSCAPGLKNMADAVAKLPADKAAKAAAIMITVDPERDTAGTLAGFVGGISPRLIGMTGSRAAINDVMEKYKAPAQRYDDPSVPGGYTYFTVGLIYVMGPQGTFYSMLQADTPADTLVKQMDALIK